MKRHKNSKEKACGVQSKGKIRIFPSKSNKKEKREEGLKLKQLKIKQSRDKNSKLRLKTKKKSSPELRFKLRNERNSRELASRMK